MLKKTFAKISKKFLDVKNECEELIEQSDARIKVLTDKERQLAALRKEEEGEMANAARLSANIDKLINEEL